MGWEADIEVFHDNWLPVLIFNELGSQWRTGGMGERTGLDYGTLYQRLDIELPRGDEWKRLYADIRTLEHAALGTMAQNAESDDE